MRRLVVVPARVLAADPPWPFGDKLPGKSRGAEKNYQLLKMPELLRFPLPPLEENAVLFLWRVSSMQQEALDVMSAWGFKLKSELVWKKLTPKGKRHFGMGRYVRAEHETCLIGVRGKCFPRVYNVRSVFEAPTGIHSQKPEEFYRIVEQMYEGPYAELFARRRRLGWACYGNEL